MPSLNSNNVRVQITTDANTAGIDETERSLRGLSKTSDEVPSKMDRVNNAVGPMAGVAAGAGVAIFGLTSFMGESVGAANRAEGALTGLSSVASAFGSNADAAKGAAQRLAADGLMTVTDAAMGLKNLLAAGFSLPEATTLMERFKDSAAFGKAGALEFGEAIVGATEGIKNGNSILVDNAGVTKNLSMMLTDAGYSAQDLSKAGTDAGVRMAIFNGILKETNPQMGDAAKLSDSAAGAQARLAAQTEAAKGKFGQAMNEALLPLINILTPMIEKIGNWINENQRLAAGIAIAIVVFLAIIAVIGTVLVVVAAVAALFGAVALSTVAAVVAIAAAVAAAVAWIIMNWEKCVGFFRQAVEWIKGHWQGILAILTGPVGTAVGVIISNRDRIIEAFRACVGAVGRAISGVKDALVGPFNDALNVIRGIADKISGVFNGIKNKAGEVVKSIKGKIPGFASGVRNFTGGMALVGERGPELVNLPRGSSVYTASQTRNMGSQGAAGSVINNYGDNHFHTAAAVQEYFSIQDQDARNVKRGLTANRGMQYA